MSSSKTLILGAGYVGHAFALRTNPVPWQTHTKQPLPESRHPNQSQFELAKADTWERLPKAEFVLWTFPAATTANDIQRAVEFYKAKLSKAHVIVLASTSAFKTDKPDETVAELSTLDLENPRVAAEEALRKEGACILHLAGIYGPGREPVNWLIKGLIKNQDAYINLIHRDDICEVVRQLFLNFATGERFCLSNGNPKRWSEVVNELKREELLPADFSIPSLGPTPQSRIISNKKVSKHLGLETFSFKTYP